mmetsp:Transcript_2117/g.4619  ORF Transcript_2117/g.4619 Transcript_2117/m.4619 type:complete len:229 (+) Transcript_2117:566-1252(+)
MPSGAHINHRVRRDRNCQKIASDDGARPRAEAGCPIDIRFARSNQIEDVRFGQEWGGNGLSNVAIASVRNVALDITLAGRCTLSSGVPLALHRPGGRTTRDFGRRARIVATVVPKQPGLAPPPVPTGLRDEGPYRVPFHPPDHGPFVVLLVDHFVRQHIHPPTAADLVFLRNPRQFALVFGVGRRCIRHAVNFACRDIPFREDVRALNSGGDIEEPNPIRPGSGNGHD